jgi:CRISPR-associated protein Csb1
MRRNATLEHFCFSQGLEFFTRSNGIDDRLDGLEAEVEEKQEFRADTIAIEKRYSELKEMVRDAVALRAIVPLEPAGGKGDKVFPPTYLGTKGTQYLTETRRRHNRDVECVLLDSVQSQANRMEMALLDLIERKSLELPYVSLSFANCTEDLKRRGRMTDLEAPHRIADVVFRQSTLVGTDTRFFESNRFREFSAARPQNAMGLYRNAPHALLFGIWKSHGNESSELAARFARLIVSEIVAYSIQSGVRAAGRLDGLGISKDTVRYVPDRPDEGFTETSAQTSARVSPATFGLGDIPPTIKVGENLGGVTFDEAEQTVVLSLAGLRKIRFGSTDTDKEDAIRTVLAALGVVAITAQWERGFDLRSRACLHPVSDPTLERLPKAGAGIPWPISLPEALGVLKLARAKAHALEVDYSTEVIELEPTPELQRLLRGELIAATSDAANSEGKPSRRKRGTKA